MNSATAMAMFYASAQMLVEQQGRDAALRRIDLVRQWLEGINENNGCQAHAGRCDLAASG